MRRHPVLRVLVGVGLAAVLTSCQPPPAGITLSPTAATIEVGHTVALAARVRPAKANQLVSWASDAESVASVSSAGLVIGISAGTATITVNSVVDSKLTAAAVITVVDGGTVLAPGGTVVGVDGVTLRALADALDQPIAVHIERIPKSEITEPLPAALTPIGHVYRVRADVGTLAADPGGFGFLLGLPVPADDVPDDLNVGFYLSGETVARWYPDHPPDEDVWEIVPGAYDADLGQWVVSLHVLTEEGYGIGLAAGAYFVEPEVPAAVTTASGVSFHVRCRDKGVKDACSDANTKAYAAALAAAHDVFTSLGFPYPKMATRYPLGLGPPTAYLYGFTTDSKNVRKCNGLVASGYYNPVTANVVVCVDDDGFTYWRESTTWHEYFHAVQHAYPFMLQLVIRRLWILEGTARVAQGVLDAVSSGASIEQLRNGHDQVHRFDSRDLRRVDVGLREQGDDVEYDTQDFWVFVGKWQERGVPWLLDVLRVGYDPVDVSWAFYHTFDGLELSEAYWAWAKNQAFEKSISLGGTAWSGPTVSVTRCSFDPHTATSINGTFGPTSTASWSATLPPLTSAVFRVLLEPDIEDYVATLSVEDNSVFSLLPHDDVMVKFYESADAASAACIGRDDARTHNVTVPSGHWPVVVYALVSNTRFDPMSLPVRVDLKARAGVVEDEASISIEKATNGADADAPPGPLLQAGDPITWTYVVENTGNVTLTDVVVTDDQIGPIACPKDELAPGESMTCSASGVAVKGQYANLGTVTGTPPVGNAVTDSDPSHYIAVSDRFVPAGVVATVNSIDAQVDNPHGESFVVRLYALHAYQSRDLFVATGTVSAAGGLSISLPTLDATQVAESLKRFFGWCGELIQLVEGTNVVSDDDFYHPAYPIVAPARSRYFRWADIHEGVATVHVYYVYSLTSIDRTCATDIPGHTDVDVRIRPGWNVVVNYSLDGEYVLYTRTGEPPVAVGWWGPEPASLQLHSWRDDHHD